MAIDTKLETIKTGVLDIRDALKEYNHSLAQSNINTIPDDINRLANNSIIVYYKNNNNEYKVSLYVLLNGKIFDKSKIQGDILSVIIPSNYTALGRNEFSSLPLEYINLGHVKDLTAIVFSDCANLKKVDLKNVEYIAGSCFARCDLNQDLYLPKLKGFCYSNQVPIDSTEGGQFNSTNIKSIKDLGLIPRINGDTFSSCNQLTEVHFPESLIDIYGNAFRYSTNISDIYYNSLDSLCNIKYRGSNAHPFHPSISNIRNVYVNNSLLTDLVIPNTCTAISDYAFVKVLSLTSLTIPNSVTSIGQYAFDDCNNLTGSLVIPNSVTSIGQYAFANCNNLTGNVTIPNTISTISAHVFENCSGLTSIVLPSTITTIGVWAFKNCTNLVSINIPEGVTTFGSGGNDQIFVGCRKIHDFTLPSTLNWADGTYYNFINLGDGTGTFTSNSGYRSGGNQTSNAYYFRKFILNGPIYNAQNYPRGMLNLSTNYGKIIILNGNLTDTSVTDSWFIGTPPNQITYCKITGTITGTENNTTNQVIKQNNANSRIILHLPNTNQLNAKSRLSDSNIVKIYFGDGTSQVTDQAILDTYLANSDWAPDSNKFDLWYNYWDRRSLPSGYTRLQYVKTDSNAWINTGILGDNNDLSFTVDFMTENYINGAGIFGNYVSENHQGWRFSLGGRNDQTWLNSNNKFSNACTPTYCSVPKDRITFDINKQTYSSIYGSGNCNTATGTVNNDPICLGNRSVNNPEEKDVGLRIYGFKIKDGDTTVIDYLPCLNSSNVPGFYDFVTNAFVPSSTQTAFIAGPELVNWDYAEI